MPNSLFTDPSSMPSLASSGAGLLMRSGVLVCALLAWPCLDARDDDYTLVVQTGLSSTDARAAFEPLASYLTRATGYRVRLEVPSTVLAHWQAMGDRDHYDLVLDEGHFTDYRVKRFGYSVLAKVAGLTGFSVVTGPETVLVEPEELYGEPVASLAPPSLAALRLGELFPDAIRAPLLVEVDSYRQGIRRVVNGDVAAAVIRSSMVREYPDLNVVMSTQLGPGLALSASPTVPAEIREAVRRAILEAGDDELGRRALARARLARFEPAGTALYDGYARLLRGTWGY
jgi:ABC-type phosphate/phosphonate transport system substrate-binding protein